ncbi:hypothetical protein L2E82_33150 [Cichorium intybus]|uniref:Uncharacterized protein n=1 Tax=Cichorium intybus TaxID=13427 RepID=A0ACB9BJG2_CICIN|nr:hypothetical protein L2E82_33150 [Cichorium intybus]
MNPWAGPDLVDGETPIETRGKRGEHRPESCADEDTSAAVEEKIVNQDSSSSVEIDRKGKGKMKVDMGNGKLIEEFEEDDWRGKWIMKVDMGKGIMKVDMGKGKLIEEFEEENRKGKGIMKVYIGKGIMKIDMGKGIMKIDMGKGKLIEEFEEDDPSDDDDLNILP